MASCQLHKSWISDAEVLPPLLSVSRADARRGTDAAMPWILSASNGGEIALWNPAHVGSQGRFSQVAEAQDVHSKGIFSMHVCPQATQGKRRNAASIEVLSCSKDCSVALTTVKGTGIEVVRAWEGVHESVAKAVRWRDPQTAASAGNDRSDAPGLLYHGACFVQLSKKKQCCDCCRDSESCWGGADLRKSRCLR